MARTSSRPFGPTSLSLGKRWSIAGALYYIKVSTGGTLVSTTPAGPVARKIDVDIDPYVYYASLRYRY